MENFYGVNQFTYAKGLNVYTQEASTLGWKVGCWPNYFTLFSSEKGIVDNFVYSKQIRNEKNNELLLIEYHSTKGTGAKAMIFND